MFLFLLSQLRPPRGPRPGSWEYRVDSLERHMAAMQRDINAINAGVRELVARHRGGEL